MIHAHNGAGHDPDSLTTPASSPRGAGLRRCSDPEPALPRHGTLSSVASGPFLPLPSRYSCPSPPGRSPSERPRCSIRQRLSDRAASSSPSVSVGFTASSLRRATPPPPAPLPQQTLLSQPSPTCQLTPPPPLPQHRRKRPAAAPTASTTTKKSRAGTSIKKAPPKRPYDMT